MSSKDKIDEAIDEALKILQEAGMDDIVIIGRNYTEQVIDMSCVDNDFDSVTKIQGALSQANHRLTFSQVSQEYGDDDDQ